MKIIQLLAISCITFALIGCRATSYLPAEPNTEDAGIQTYLKENKLHKEAKKTDSGIYYIIEEEGEGEHLTDPEESVVLRVNSGDMNSDLDDYSEVNYNIQSQMIPKGIHEAMSLMKSGGKAKFIIPSVLFFGEQNADVSPPPPPRVFDIEWLTPEEVAQADAEAMEKLFKAPSPAQIKKEDAEIQAYLKENNLDKKAKKTDSGMYYIIEKEGEGEHPIVTQTAMVHYHGTLLDGTVFDSSVERGQPAEIPLSRLFKGWQEAIMMMKPGGKGKFIIPSNLVFGESGSGPVPPSTSLIIDMELITPEGLARLEAEAKKKAEAEAETLAQPNEDAEIQAYLKKNNLDSQAKKTDSGMYYIMEKEGEGEHPTMDETITAHYHGSLLDGTVFDSSVERGQPSKFQLGRVIKGWQEAMGMMKPGGKGKFIIPSTLAYGERGAGKMIGPNMPLIFDIELFSKEEADKLEAEAKEKAKAKAREQAEKDDAIIKAHLAKLGIDKTAKRTDSGIYYTIEKEGEGKNPTVSDKVEVHYHGTLLDGTVFDSSGQRGKPTEFPLNRVVKGWQEAIPLLKPGGKGTFYIPSGLCYGPNPRPGGKIKPNDVLVFEVELFEIK